MNFKTKILIIIIVANFITGLSLYSQQFLKNFGIKSELSFLSYSYDFNSLPNIPRPNIPLTISNNDPVIGFGGMITFNISDNILFSSSLLFNKSGLDFQDFENVTVIIRGEPVEAIIRHNLETEINNLELSLGLIYNFLETFNFTIGVGLNFPISSTFKQNQTIISPDNLEFIYPIGNHEGKINNLNKIIFLPKAAVSLEENILSIGKIGISPEISYKFNINSLLSISSWKFSSFSAGINLVYINKKNLFFSSDTIFTRDTLLNHNSQIKIEAIILKETSANYDTLFSDNSITYITKIKETYERIIPKPIPILSGELRTVFVSDNGTESVSKEIEYVKNIYYIHYFEKKGKREKLTSRIDTISSLKIPFIRFYPSAFSEVGLKEWQIKISRDNKLFKTFIGYDSMTDVLDWHPFEKNFITEFNNITFNYEFIVKDYEDQEITASTGEINFIKSQNGEKINHNSLILIEPSKIVDKNFQKLLANLKKQKKVVLYHPFASGMEEIIKPDFIIEPNAEILEVTSSINIDKTMIIIGFN